jgi:hypothetical protein
MDRITGVPIWLAAAPSFMAALDETVAVVPEEVLENDKTVV